MRRKPSNRLRTQHRKKVKLHVEGLAVSGSPRRLPYLTTLPLASPPPPPYSAGVTGTLPEPFATWFAAQGWTPRPHQLAMLDAAATGESRAVDRAHRRRQDPCRLPAQPCRARQSAPRPAHPLCQPAEGAGHRHCPQPDGVRCRIWAADHHRDPHRRHARQPPRPPTRAPRQMLLTTPESLAVLLSLPDAPDFSTTWPPGDGRGPRAGRHQARRPARPLRRSAGAPSRPAPAASACPRPSPTPTRIQAYFGANAADRGADGAPPALR